MKPIMTISVDHAGNIRVNGPVHNKMMCYGLLEAAKDAVRDYKPNEPKIEVAGAAEQELKQYLAAGKE